MIIAGSLHPNEHSMHTADLRAEPIWPNEEQLAYFERTLPAPSREQLLGQLTGETIIEAEPSTVLRDAEAPESDRAQKIEGYLKIANSTSCIWLYRDAKQSTLESSVSGFSYTTDPYVRPLKSSPELWEETKQYPTLGEFIKKGIYETCTLQQLNGWEHPKYEGEKMYGLAYEASGDGYEDGSGRNGNVMWVKFLLPESVARKLWGDARKDPTILRDMSEHYAKEHVLSDAGKAPGGDWDRYGRPPYEAWDARSENVMAFRHNFDEGPSGIPPSRLIPINPKAS